jgi:gamma-glutamyltranspeptidase / glutathione hydrolase
MRLPVRAFLPCLSAIVLAACATPAATPPDTLPAARAVPHPSPVATGPQAPLAPEAASGYQPKPGWVTRRHAVAAAHPLATEAGHQVLRDGGSAIDAAIAVQLVLTLVEPQSSGIGGGAFVLHWDGREVAAFDGRETAPAAATERLFLKADGQALGFHEAVVGGRSVGTPGALSVMWAAHRRHGALPWSQLFQPAIRLAEEGFAVSPRLHTLLQGERFLKQDPVAAAYFYRPDGQPHPIGTRLRNPELAGVLRAVAQHGPDAFYRGRLARDIVAKVQGHAGNPGLLSEADLATYQPRTRAAMCTDWRRWRLCGFPPPSSGHIAIMQMLGMLEHVPADAAPLDDQGLPSADFLHRYTEAARLAFADRALHVADPDFVPAPAGDWTSLLAPAYLKRRAALIGPRSMKVAPAGDPGGAPQAQAPMPDQPEYGTSHISVIDGAGRAVAMTTTIEDQFGARQMVHGFLLNNQLSDFSFSPADAQGRPVANRVQPGKRPRSSMSPTLVFDKMSGQLVMSTGSPGGALIIHFTAKTLLGALAWGLNPQQAIDLPNFGSTNGPTLLEERRFPAATKAALQARGHELRETAMTSGLQAIQRVPGGLFGGADPRREGLVAGD